MEIIIKNSLYEEIINNYDSYNYKNECYQVKDIFTKLGYKVKNVYHYRYDKKFIIETKGVKIC